MATSASSPDVEVLTEDELRSRFMSLLGYNPHVPAADWRAVGDPDTMHAALQSITAWLDANGRGENTANLPEVPNVLIDGEWTPAAGTREVFDLALVAARSGITTSRVVSAWYQAKGAVINQVRTAQRA